MNRASMARQLEQLLLRIRELELEVARLKSEAQPQRRAYAEAILAAAEAGDTMPGAIGAVSSGAQSPSSGTASVLELIPAGGGAYTLKPVQAAGGTRKAKVPYLNVAASAPQLWTDAGEPMLLVRLADGRFVRFPAGGGGTTVDVVVGFRLSGTKIQYRSQTIKVNQALGYSAWTDLLEFVC